MCGASGMEGASVYKSAVMYHTNSPTWAETVSLAVPLDRFQFGHLRLEYRHCSSKLGLFRESKDLKTAPSTRVQYLPLFLNELDR